MWALKETDVCVNHFVPLVMQCPKCKKAHGPMTWYSKPGYCPRCRSWLGHNAFKHSNHETDVSGAVAEWCRFKSLGVGHLVSVRPEQITSGTAGIFARNIRFLLDRVFNGSLSAFERTAHHARWTLKRWAAGEQLPQLLSVLFLAYRLKLLPQDLLLTELSGDRPIDIRPCPNEVTMRVRRKKQRRDREGIRNYLQSTLNAHIDPPPSFRRVCLRAQIDQAQTAKTFPDLAKQLMDRYQRYVDNRAAERKGKILAALHQAISTIKARGELPSWGRLRKELEDPSCLREEWVWGEWKRIAQEMGYPCNELLNRPPLARANT
jgi:hypothetical protein